MKSATLTKFAILTTAMIGVFLCLVVVVALELIPSPAASNDWEMAEIHIGGRTSAVDRIYIKRKRIGTHFAAEYERVIRFEKDGRPAVEVPIQINIGARPRFLVYWLADFRGDGGGIVKCCVLRSFSSGGFLQDSVLEGTAFDDECDLFVAA